MQEYNRNKSLIKRNILNFLTVSGISKYEFYKNSGISRGTLDNASGLTEENIIKFLTYAPNVDPKWLLLGEGEMLKSTTGIGETSTHTSGIVYEPTQGYTSAKIPVYNVRNAAILVDLLNGSSEMEAESHLQIPNLETCDGAVYVTSDAMYPLLKKGDLAVYKSMKDKENSLFWGEMYLMAVQVETEEMILLGYVQKSEKGEGYITVRGYNPQHEPKEISLKQILAFAHIRASLRIN